MQAFVNHTRIVLICCLGLLLSGFAYETSAQCVFINNLQHTGTDQAEIVGPAGTDFSCYTLVPYNQAGTPATSATFPKDGTIIDCGLSDANDANWEYSTVTGFAAQQGPNDAVALVNTCNGNQVVQFIEFEDNDASGVTANGGLANGATASILLTGTTSSGFSLTGFTIGNPQASNYINSVGNFSGCNDGQSFGASCSGSAGADPECGDCTGAGGLYITEVNAGAGTDGECEFIEIFNAYSNAITTGPDTVITISGGVDYTFPPGTVIPSGSYVVIARSISGLASAANCPFMGMTTSHQYSSPQALTEFEDVTITLECGENETLNFTNTAFGGSQTNAEGHTRHYPIGGSAFVESEGTPGTGTCTACVDAPYCCFEYNSVDLVCVGELVPMVGPGTPAALTPYLSSDPSIATVDMMGNVTAVAVGTAMITYQNEEGCTATAAITIIEEPVCGACTSTGGIFITEVNSGAGTADVECEFIEIFNAYSNAITTSASTTITISGGADYTFPTGTVIPAGGYIVIARSIMGLASGSMCPFRSFTTSHQFTGALIPSEDITVTISSLIDATLNFSNTASGGTQTNEDAFSRHYPIDGSAFVEGIGTPGKGTCSGCADSPFCSLEYNDVSTLCIGATVEMIGPGTANSIMPYSSSDDMIASVDMMGTVTGVAPGIATITYKDADGCVATATVTVIPLPTVTASNSGPYCSGENIQLTASFTPEGISTSANNWAWSGPNGFTSSIKDPIAFASIAQAAGTYVVTVTDNNGCSNTASKDVVVNELPICTAGSNSPVCTGTTLNLTETGGDGMSWLWTGPNSFTSTDQNPTINTMTSAESGTYTVIITDSKGCKRTCITEVFVHPVPSVAVGGLSMCIGATAMASPISGPSGGTPPYTESWTVFNSGGTGITNVNLTNANTNTVTINTAGLTTGGLASLEYKVADKNGCEISGLFDLTIEDLPTLSAITNNPTTCEGSDGSITLTLTNVDDGIYTINYMDATPASHAFTGVMVTNGSAMISGLAQGVYNNLTLTANGCTSTADVDITLTDPGAPAAPATSPVSYCVGETASALTATGTGGLTWYTDLTGGTILSSAPTPSTIEAATTTYYVSQSISGCESNRASLAVTIKDLPSLTIEDPTICYDGSTMYDLRSLEPIGMTGGEWSDASMTVISSAVVTPVNAAIYNYSFTGSNDCQVTVPVTLTVISKPDINDPIDVVLCAGESFILPEISGANLTGNESYWTMPNASGSTFVVGSPITTSQTIYLYDSNSSASNCFDEESFTVTVNSLPPAPTVNPVSFCIGESTTALTATGTGVISWYSDLTSDMSLSSAPTPATTTSGITTYYVSQTVSGCESNRAILAVTVHEVPTLSATSSNPTSCGGSDGSINLILTNVPDGSYTINYMDATPSAQTFTGVMVTGGSATISSLTQGVYNNLSIEVNGCMSVEDVDIMLTDPGAPDAPTTSPVIYCVGEAASGLIAIGTGTLNWYKLSTGGVAEASAPIPSTETAGTTTYYVSQTISGCESNRTSIVVTVNPLPIATLNNPTVCIGSTSAPITLDVTSGAPTMYAIDYNDVSITDISSSATLPTMHTLPATLGMGSYTGTITYTDANGCTGTDEFTITVQAATAAGTDGNLTVCNADPSEYAFNLIDELGGTPGAGGIWSETTSGTSSGITPSAGDLGTVSFQNIVAGTYEFTYTISASGSCPEASAKVVVAVKDCFDLALKKELTTAGTVRPGDDVSFDITVVNQGEVDAYDVDVTDYFPACLTAFSFAYSSHTLVATAPTISALNIDGFTISTIPVGGEVVVTVTMTIDNACTETTITNNAEITGGAGSVGANNALDVDSTPGDDESSIPDSDDDNLSNTTGGDDFDAAIVTICQTGCAFPWDGTNEE